MDSLFKYIKEVLALIGFISLVVLTFTKIVPPEAFLTLVGMIIQYYFHSSELKNLQHRIDDKDGQIQALSVGKAVPVKLE